MTDVSNEEMENKESQQYYLECLKHDLAKAVGRSITTYTDFNYLFLQLKSSISDAPSVSTLKRLWAYVADNSSRSRTTLNALSRFLGFDDWTAYIDNLMRKNRVESGFLSVKSIVATNMTPGDIIEFEWHPDRHIEARYEGDSLFTVTVSHNASLAVGARFSTLLFTKGLPLVCSSVSLDGKQLGEYVAGSRNGLTAVSYTPCTDID